MNKTGEFDNIITTLSKYETRIDNFLLQADTKIINGEQSKFMAFQEPPIEVKDPKICIWEFLDKKDLEKFLLLERKSDIRKRINSKIGKGYPKGTARTIFLELIYTVTKSCKKFNFNLEKSGALLSQFYLTHLFFTSKFDMSAEKVYTYFKDLALIHSLPFAPTSIKLYSQKETKQVMDLFCKLYLRNLPIIRFLSLPNFAFCLNYELEPEPVLKASGKKKGKK